MFLSATLTYGFIIVVLGFWFWHVWCKAANVKLDPAEESVFNIKRGVKKSCGCTEPCECISNTQAKKASKMAKAKQAAEQQQARPKRPARKIKSSEASNAKPPATKNSSNSDSSQPTAQPTAAAHSSKKSQNASEKKFNVIELIDEPSDEQDLGLLNRSELPDRWITALKRNGNSWSLLTSTDQREIELNFKKLSNTYTKLCSQRRKVLPVTGGELGGSRLSEQNKFAVFEETVMARDEEMSAEELAELVLKCEDYSPLDKVEFLKVLIDDLQHELYRLGDQGLLPPSAAAQRRRVAMKSKPQVKKGSGPSSRHQNPQDWIPGLPVDMM